MLSITALAVIFIPFMAPHAETVTHTYDDLNRLIRTEYSDGTTIIYDYNELGNRMHKKKLYKPHVLTVQKTGAGSGTIVSAPARINCGPTCTEMFSEGTQVTLTPAPDSGFLFIQWSGGGCSGTGPCVVTMNADTTVAGLFQSCSSLPVKMAGAYYSGIQAAYNAAGNGAVIQVQNVTLVENLNANRTVAVTFDGGYSCDYSGKAGSTTVQGMITTSSGQVTIGNFILQN